MLGYSFICVALGKPYAFLTLSVLFVTSPSHLVQPPIPWVPGISQW